MSNSDESGPVAQPEWLRRTASAPGKEPPWRPSPKDVEDGRVTIGDQFTLKEPIGEGRYGRVYRARDNRLDRDVAIKLMREADPEEDFKREARITARAHHSNIVTIFGYGLHGNIPYLVLELLTGCTLHKQVGRRTFSLLEAVTIGAEVAAALAAAHKEHVTHRDLSPRNVMLTDAHEVKVLDFGFAAFGPPGWRAGGTPGFASPEQIEGRDESGRSDLWSLGALVYWLVAGTAPFVGDTLASYRESVRAGPARPLRDRLHTAPEVLDLVVTGLLDKDPAKRPEAAEARDVLRDLRDDIEARLAPRERPPRAPRNPVVKEPFRPLQPFGPGDANLFFGRHDEAHDLAELVRLHRLVVLRGPSGTGKSSLLQAALRPLLESEMLWLDIAPPADPKKSALHGLVRSIVTALAARGVSATEGAPDALLASLCNSHDRPLLLVLDQFEEIFQHRTREERERAIRELGLALRRAVDLVGPKLRLLISVRGDYLEHVLDFQADDLLPGILDHSFRLERLGENAARLAVEWPFELAGFDLPRSLARRIRDDLLDDGQVVPVELELVCHALYQRAVATGQRSISEQDYRDLGGRGRVLAEHLAAAERTWPADVVFTAREICTKMVSADGTRPPPGSASMIAKESGQKESAVEDALSKLVAHRIVQAEGVQGSSERRYRIAHDHMAQAVWNRLSEEQRENLHARDALRVLSRQAPTRALGRALWFVSMVPADTRSLLLRWRKGGSPGANELDRAFLHELAAWDRRAHRGKWIAAMASLALAAALVAVVWTQREKLREEQARAAEANAEHEVDLDPGKAFAWLMEAARLRGGFEKENERAYHDHWLLAREAWRAGAGWIVADHGGKEVVWVRFSPPELAYRQATGEPCPACWPNQKRLVSAGKDGLVRVLDLAVGGRSVELPGGSQEALLHAAISPDGCWVAAGGKDKKLHIWNLKTQTAQSLSAPISSDAIQRVEFSADVRWLAVARSFGGIELWKSSDITGDCAGGTWQHYRQWKGHSRTITALTFSPRENRLLSADEGGRIRITQIPDGESVVVRESAKLDSGSAAYFAPDAAWFGAVIQQQVMLFDDGPNTWTEGKALARPNAIIPHADAPTTLALHHNAGRDMVAIGTFEGEVSLWQRIGDGWERLRKVYGHEGAVTALWFSRDGEQVLSGGRDGRVFLADVQSYTSRLFRGGESRVKSAVLSPDGRVVAAGSVDGLVRLWIADEGRVLVRQAGAGVFSVAASSPHERVIAGLVNGEAVVWDGLERGVTERHDSLGGQVNAICSLPDRRIVAGAQNGVTVFDADGNGATHLADYAASIACLPDGRVIVGGEKEITIARPGYAMGEVVGSHEDFVASLAVGSAGALISGSYDGTTVAWNWQQHTQLGRRSFGSAVTGVSVLGEREAAVSLRNGRVWLWNWTEDTARPLEPPHAGTVDAVATHPTARLLVSAGTDGLVLRWVDSGASRSVRGCSGAQKAVFADDGQSMVSAGGDRGMVQIWPLAPTDRGVFRDWAQKRTPWSVENGRLVPKELPPLDAITGPALPPPPDECIEECLADYWNGALPAGETAETCVLRKLCDACKP